MMGPREPLTLCSTARKSGVGVNPVCNVLLNLEVASDVDVSSAYALRESCDQIHSLGAQRINIASSINDHREMQQDYFNLYYELVNYSSPKPNLQLLSYQSLNHSWLATA